MNICVLGLGYIGLPTAILMAKKGHRVFGYDINNKVKKILENGNVHIIEENLEQAYKEVYRAGNFTVHNDIQVADVYLIAVPTPLVNSGKDKIADLTFVRSATTLVASKLKSGDLVILESTSPPYTTRYMTQQLSELSGLKKDDFFTAYCPERVLPGNILFELEHNDRIIGSEREESAQKAKELYSTFVEYGDIYITDDVTAELCKLVENSYRDINIALANELSIICDKLNIDVANLINLANKHPRVNILSPGVGVGGHCIAIDPYFIVEQFKDEAKLIAQARAVNEHKTVWVASKIEERVGYDKNTVIGILGLAYKANVGDLRESPSIKLAHYLIERGYKVIANEPYLEVESINGIPLYPLEKVLSMAGLSVMTLRHDEYIRNFQYIQQTNTMILC
jgi:UDP-N-acetyl-D-mannosaminuronic acid dehydrogenase